MSVLLVEDDLRQSDETRLLLMLVVSLLLHGALLWAWKTPTPRLGDGQSVLTVLLKARAATSSAPPAIAQALPAEQKLIDTPTVSETSKVNVHRPPNPPRVASVPSVSASTAEEAAPVQAAMGVSVLLQLNADGQVGQILWNELPALTDAQLHRLEMVIRARPYMRGASGRTIKEIVDIRAMLAVPTSQTNGVLPAPTGE